MNNNNKKTLVIGASTKPERYSNKAIKMLEEYGHEIVALAKREGKVNDVSIQTKFPENEKIHTVTLYLSEKFQSEYYSDIIRLKPHRVIFNPGTENFEFKKILDKEGIEVVEGCTLVMLRTNQY